MKTAIVFFIVLMSSVAFSQEPVIPVLPPLGAPGTPVQIQQGSRPVPDPTTLTAEAIRELRAELTKWIDIVDGNLQSQIDRQTLRLDRIPDELSKTISELEKLTAEKFKGLADQQVQRDNNLALALTAAQKSVSDTNLSTAEAARKAETTFKDQIDGTQKGIDELKDRITRIESASSGAGGAINWVIAGTSILIAIVGGVIGVVSFLRTPVPLPVMPVAQAEFEPTKRRR